MFFGNRLIYILEIIISGVLLFLSISMYIHTADYQKTPYILDYLLIFSLDLILLSLMFWLRKHLNWSIIVGITSILFLVSSLFLLAWGRFLLQQFYVVIIGLIFNASRILFLLFSAVLVTIIYILIKSRYYNSLVVLLISLPLIVFFLIGYKYNIIEAKMPENDKIKLVLNNLKYSQKFKEICRLGTEKDIRYLRFSSAGVLYGSGGNQSYSELDNNFFMFEPYNCNSMKTHRAVEVKYFAMDERRGEIYYADFQKKNLVKLNMSDLSVINEVQISGISPQLISEEDSDYLYLIYDQPLWIEKRRKADLLPELRLDILKSGICRFGSIGISLSFGYNDYLFGAFMNCTNGIVKIDNNNLFPVQLLKTESDIIWYITSSKINNALYVAHPFHKFIAEYDLNNSTLRRRIKVGYGIRFILESMDGKLLYAADYLSGKIYKIELKNNKILSTYQFGRKTYAIAEHPQTHNIFVAGPAGVYEIEYEDEE